MAAQPWPEVRRALGAALGRDPGPVRARPVGGGCINEAFVVEGAHGRWFVKVAAGPSTGDFEAEADGLRALGATGALRVPEPIAVGSAGDRAFLVLEHIELRAPGPGTFAALGEALARLHRSSAPRFGWHRDNAIGRTPQRNRPGDDWTAFFRDRRLGEQLARVAERGLSPRLVERGEALCARLDRLLAGHRPVPSLLHGDLWGGNHAAGADGSPVVFDPAVYHGDREADLAMTELFGGFGPEFRAAYRAAWPLEPGYPLRRDLYNLYHVLNHLNLFGGAYLARAEHLVDRLLAETG